MICPGCEKPNDPKRRYCGRCGTNFQPVCRRCNFANAKDDRYCGGCGAMLVASEGVHVKHVAMPEKPAMHTAPVATPAAPPPVAMKSAAHIPGDELNGLFTAPATPVGNDVVLPETGVSQDDLDRLFGVAL